MAKLVLLRFEDDKAADTLIEDMQQNPDAAILTPIQENDIRGVVVGEYKEPVLFCECPPEKRDKSGRSKAGKKYGWWIRACCGRPAKYGGQRPNNLFERAQGKKPWQVKYMLSINSW